MKDLDINRIVPSLCDSQRIAIETVLMLLPWPPEVLAREAEVKINGLVITAGFKGNPPLYVITCSDNAEAELDDRVWCGLNSLLSRVTLDVATALRERPAPVAPDDVTGSP